MSVFAYHKGTEGLLWLLVTVAKKCSSRVFLMICQIDKIVSILTDKSLMFVLVCLDILNHKAYCVLVIGVMQ